MTHPEYTAAHQNDALCSCFGGSFFRIISLISNSFDYTVYALLIEKYDININRLISGTISMFINQGISQDDDSISKLQNKIKFSNDDMNTLLEILISEAGRGLILKFIEIKRGNKEALNSLIENLQVIKAVF